MRLRVTGYYQDEYLYSLTNEGLTMNYKEYSVNKHKIVVARKKLKNHILKIED